MSAAVGIAVKGAAVGTATTASGASQATGSTFYIFMVWDSFSTFTSVADNKGNSANYTLVGTEQTVGSFKTRLYKCVNGAGGSGHTATVVVSGGGQPTVFLIEATGCDTSTPVDQSDRRADSTTPFTLAAGLTTTQNNELLLTFLGGDSSSNPTTLAESGLGSSTIVVSETNGAANWTSGIAWSYKTSTGTFNPSWTSSGATNTIVYLETLKEAAGAGSSTPGKTWQAQGSMGVMVSM